MKKSLGEVESVNISANVKSGIFDEFELPGGLVDSDGNLHKEVELDEMRGIDEEILSSPKYDGKFNLALHNVLARCVKRIGSITTITLSVIRQLLVGDRDYVLLRLNRFTNGPDIDTTGICSECGYKNKIHFSVDDINIKELDKGKRAFNLILPKGVLYKGNIYKDVEIELPGARISEEMEIYINRKEYSEALNVLFSKAITKIGDLDSSLLDRELFRNMSTKDRNFLIEEINKKQPGPEYTTIKFICDKCGKDSSFQMSSSSFFG